MINALRAIAILSAVVWLLVPAIAVAEDFVDPHWDESPINFTAGFKFGLGFMMDEDFQDVYGEKGIPFYSLEAGWKMVHHLELHAEMAYWWDQGRGIAESGKQTNEKYKLHMAPAELGLLYRFNYTYDQIVVPYLGGSGVYSYYLEERLESSWKKRGGIYGAAAKGGLMLLLDKAETLASSKMERDFGINNTYLVYNFKYMILNNFEEEKGLDLSNHIHTLGVIFEF